MSKTWAFQPQRLVQQQLFGRIGDVILTSNHMTDRHSGVINNHNEVVQRVANRVCRSSPGDDHIATKIGAAPLHRTAHQVGPSDGGFVINPKTNHRFSPFSPVGLLLFTTEMAVTVVVTRRPA